MVLALACDLMSGSILREVFGRAADVFDYSSGSEPAGDKKAAENILGKFHNVGMFFDHSFLPIVRYSRIRAVTRERACGRTHRSGSSHKLALRRH